MREIKFRGKSGTQWRYGDLYHNEHGELVIHEPQSRGQTLEGKAVDGWRIKVDPGTVGQFTGLYDANGREIYEGDVVQSKELLFPYDTGVIRYCAELTRFYLDTGDGDINDLSDDEGLTVLSNVYDNPELLERKP